MDLEDDILGIDSTLFGDILLILEIGTFILDNLVGERRPTYLFAAIHSDSNKLVAICLRREIPFSSFDVVSTHRSTGSVPL